MFLRESFGDAERYSFTFVRQQGIDGFIVQKVCSTARKYESASTPDKTGCFSRRSQGDFISMEGNFQEIARTKAEFLPQILRKDEPASFIDGNKHFFHTMLKYHYNSEMATKTISVC
jgi:hypothetical protein